MNTWAEKIHKNRILEGFSLPISVILDMNGQKMLWRNVDEYRIKYKFAGYPMAI